MAQRFVLDSALQGETRSQGFFYVADGERAGVLGLRGSASIVFLRNEARRFTRLTMTSVLIETCCLSLLCISGLGIQKVVHQMSAIVFMFD